MFERDNKANIWVSSEAQKKGDGSLEFPFATLKEAIEKVKAGSTIVLKAGVYKETLSLSHIKGEEQKPITIIADPEGESVRFHNEWYLYEVSDLIIDGIHFENIRNSAISIVGTSERNIFKNLTFTSCGEDSECTFFMGGSGGRFNIVEHCLFQCEKSSEKQIALMISQSIDCEDESVRVTQNAVVRYNSFKNYGTTLIVGSGDSIDEAGNHLIEENLFEESNEALRIKAAGITVKGNIFRKIEKAISYLAGLDTDITENRFEETPLGIDSFDGDITIHQNLFLNSSIAANTEEKEALPIIIHNNTFVFTKLQEKAIAILGEAAFIAGVSDNILVNGAIVSHSGVSVHGNISNLSFETSEEQVIVFDHEAEGDYSISTAAGCHGPACNKKEITPPPAIDLATLAHTHTHDDEGEVIEVKGSIEERDLYLKTLYLNNQEDEKGEVVEEEDEDNWPMDDEELPSQYDYYEDGLLLD